MAKKRRFTSLRGEAGKTVRAQTIISMKKKRATLEQIGDSLGLTRERARVLVNSIADEYGSEAYRPEGQVWTVDEAAIEVSSYRKVIIQLCNAGEISFRRRDDTKSKSVYLIDEVGIQQLRVHPAVTHARICAFCDGIFMYLGARDTCSDECRVARNLQVVEAYRAKEPSLDSLNGWHKELWRRLQGHVACPDSERWVVISEASQLSGLSHQQLTDLRRRRIATIHTDPIKKWRGRSVSLYSASEMKIAKEVFQEFGPKKD